MKSLSRILKLSLISSWVLAGVVGLGSKSFPLIAGPEPAAPPAAQSASLTTAAQPQANPADYVGSAVCKACHGAKFTDFSRTAHAKLEQLPNWSVPNQGCEACHGPGKAHVQGVGDKTKIRSFKQETPKQLSEACLRCHAGQEEHNNYRRGEHWRNDVGCTACHDPHPATASTLQLLRQKEPALCLSCHTEIKAQFAKPFRHKVLEGAMKCSDCHNPHGGFELKQARLSTGTDGACLKCHTDKQGPFMFEHPPVKTEGCAICHSPHGSSNPKLLKRPVVQQLCLECHTNVGNSVAPNVSAFHNLASIRFQNCTTCHVKIHGSQTDHYFLR